MRIPWIARDAAEPMIAHSQCAEGKLGDQDGAGFVEALHHGGVFVDDLLFETPGTPGSWITFHCEQIFGAPGQAV